jgi:hypothetical protein
MQMRAVAEANVVITNHGAFEGNMIYMKNSSLLLEIFGHYGNNEIHTFHRLALNLGVYYARIQPMNLNDHQMRSFVMAPEDMAGVVNITQSYFDNKAYMTNAKHGQ